MVLTGTILDPLEHVLVDLLLASIWDSPRDSVLKFDQWLLVFTNAHRQIRKRTDTDVA